MGIIFRNGRKYSGTRVVDDADHLFAEDTTGTSVSAQTMLSNILGDFATMEDSVAQENHSVGDYIVLGSYFYKVTDAITAGDTFVEGVNGNIERTNVGAEMAGIVANSQDVRYAAGGTGQTQYSDSTLYNLLKNSSDIHYDEIQFFRLSFYGGVRSGMCYLYGETKVYGWILVFHYNTAPRFLGVSDGVVTIRQWTTT